MEEKKEGAGRRGPNFSLGRTTAGLTHETVGYREDTLDAAIKRAERENPDYKRVGDGLEWVRPDGSRINLRVEHNARP